MFYHALWAYLYNTRRGVIMSEISKIEAFETIKEILVEVLEADEDEITLETALQDLDMESLDFLDLSFKIEQKYQIKFPEREIANLGSILGEKRMEVIEELAAQANAISFSDNDKEAFNDMDFHEIVAKANELYDTSLRSGDIEKGNQALREKIIEHLHDLGFVSAVTEFENINDFSIDDTPWNMQAKVFKIFTVQMLVDFVCEAAVVS